MNAGTLAITGGHVVPVDGEPIPGGTVLISGSTITAVGTAARVPVPDGVRIVDARGLWVLPGLVEAHSHLGVSEEGEAGDAINEPSWPDAAALRVLDGINPADTGFADALAGGVTTAVVMPGSAGPIGGQTAAVKCHGRTVEEMLVRAPAGVKSALGENPIGTGRAPATRFGTAAILRDAFRAARDQRTRGAAGRDTAQGVLARVLDGELPWCQHAHRADDIATALRLADEFGYRLVLHHGTEAHLLADLIAARGVPVVCGPLLTGRSKVELRHKTLRNPGILARAGVQIAITTDHNAVPISFLVHQATLAMKEGLDRDTALRSVTLNPARMLGLDDRVGALRPGLDADVVLWSGDPLEVMSRALRVFIEGREVYRYGSGAEDRHRDRPAGTP